MELDTESEAGIRRFLNQKHGKKLIEYLYSKLPMAKRTDFKELVPAALMAAEMKGFLNIIEDITDIQNNTKQNNNNVGNR